MNDKAMLDILRMYDSLQSANDRAGGTRITWERLQTMTVAELILLLGPNGVRFCNEEDQKGF